MLYRWTTQPSVVDDVCMLGLPGDYHMPFEDEVGLHPTLEEMQDVVVSSRKRPQFKPHWLKNEVAVLLPFLWSPYGIGQTVIFTGSIARSANLPVFSLLRGQF